MPESILPKPGMTMGVSKVWTAKMYTVELIPAEMMTRSDQLEKREQVDKSTNSWLESDW